MTAEIEVHGAGTVKHFVEGELVLEYEKPQLDPKDADAKKLIKDGKLLLEEGYISLQAESHPVRVPEGGGEGAQEVEQRLVVRAVMHTSDGYL